MITLRNKMKMKLINKCLTLAFIIFTFSSSTAQSNDSLFYPHSLHLNVAGLGFERWAIGYEWRMTPKHALFIQGGGSYPYYSQEKEYGFGLHYKYFFKPVRNTKFLWLFKTAYKNSFVNVNVRYMNLDGIHNVAESMFEAYYIGAGIGKTWVWNSGFTVSYWLGYGPPIGGEYKWKNTVPEDGES